MNSLSDALTLRELEALKYYSIKFARLRVDRAHGIAPHKPILILSVIELIKVGSINGNKIFLSPKLVNTFLKHWKYLGSDSHNPDISLPFFHLRGDKFWHLIPNPGFTKIINSKIKLKTFAEVKRAIKYAYIDDALFELLQNYSARASLVNIIAQKWFYCKNIEIEQHLLI